MIRLTEFGQLALGATCISQWCRRPGTGQEMNIEGAVALLDPPLNDMMELSYWHGAPPLPDLLDSQRARSETLQIYNQTRADHARNRSALDSVTGKAVNG